MPIEVLVRLHDGPGGRTAGDIVNVKDVPCSWGRGEGPPNYGIVSIADTTKEEFMPYFKRHLPEEDNGQGGMHPEVRSKYRLKVEDMGVFAKAPKDLGGKALLATQAVERRVEIKAIGPKAIK